MLATSPNLEDGNDIRYYYQRQEQEGHQITCPLDREALERNKVSTTTLIGTGLRYQYGDGNVMGKHKQKQKAEREILHQFLADW